MSVLDRDALETSPLADLHTIAGELSIDGYRRLRKAELIERIIARQDGTAEAEDEGADAEAVAAEAEAEAGAGSARRRRGRRGGRGRSREDGDGEAAIDADAASGSSANEASVAPEKTEKPARSSRRSARKVEPEDEADTAPEPGREPEPEPEELVEGVVELVGNGSGFVRTSPPDPSEDDVYISAGQVKRCELVSGDRISGPKRRPRRSERFASLIRVDTINGRPAAEVSDRGHYDELPADFPGERFRLGSEEPTLKAIEFLTPFGRGSRVTIVGGARAGKSHALRSLAEALAGIEQLQLFVALAGIRPEEISDWPKDGPLAPAAALNFAASGDALDHLVELVIDQARRIASRGGDAVVLIDTLDGLHPHAARKATAAARKLVDGGSLTVIATSTRPIGGETTVIALDPALAAAGRFPALDLVASGTLRPELLVGDAGAQAIAEARAQALDGAS